MNRKQRKMLLRILVAAAMMLALHFLPVEGIPRLVLYLLPYLIVGYDILLKAGKGVGNGQLLDENFLMALATVGAIVLGAVATGDYVEAVAVMLFYQIGELFQSYAVGKSRKSIGALMDIRPDYARLADSLEQVDPEEVAIGSVILVNPGERIPLDGVILEGQSSLDTAALTGESLPQDVQPGDRCCSGCINLTGVLRLRTEKAYADSTVARILELVENAAANKSRSEKFISRFARIYTPVVCLGAVVLAVLPSLMDGQWLLWIYRALTFLVASCPCALVISIPLSFFAGLGGASKAGILIKGANYLEALSKVKTVAFDKTGTLTKGEFEISRVLGENPEKVLYYAAAAERASTHPISKCLQGVCPQAENAAVSDIREQGGFGITANVDGEPVAVGNEKLMTQLEIDYMVCDEPGTVVYVAVSGVQIGCVLLRDGVKETAAQAIRWLERAGVTQTVMLTGDSPEAANLAADTLGISKVYSRLLPGDKVVQVERLLREKPKGSALAFVGDGINDAPVLTRADIGIAMGVLGSDAAIEAADVVLMDDDPRKLAAAIGLSRKCMTIVYENIVFAIGVKLGCLVLVALGLGGMGLAIFADVGVMVLAILNAIRALFIRKRL